MANRYAEDIKRIVGIDETKSELSPAEERDSLPARRGIGYMSVDGRDTKSVSGTSPSGDSGSGTQLHSVETGNLDEGFPDNGNWVDPRDPTNSIRTASDGVYDVEDLIDGVNSPTFSSNPSGGLGGYEDVTGGTLASMTGIVDCASGDEIELVMGPDDPPPPEGWDAWNDPPPELEWTAGINYLDSNSTGTLTGVARGHNISEAADNPVNAVGPLLGIIIPGATGADADIIYQNFFGPNNPNVTEYVIAQPCALDVDSFCSSAGPSNIFHEADNKMTLRWEDGKFVSNPYEAPADVIAAYENTDISQIDFCFGSGASRNGTIRPAINGGFMIYETSGGTPTGIIKVFDAQSQMYAATDITGLQAYLPQ